MRVLFAEDDRAISSAVKKRLQREGYITDICDNGRDAYDFMLAADYDVILMDIMMPGEDGVSVVRKARAAGVHTPVVFLTARDSVADRVAGLDAGGDDYLVKPFAMDELLARIRVMMRRRSDGGRTDNVLAVADLRMDMSSRCVTRNGKSIVLTAKEYALLETMMRNAGIVLSRSRIEQKLFGYDYMGASNMVDVYIRYLRKKLDEGFDRRLIHTVRGVGYVLREEP